MTPPHIVDIDRLDCRLVTYDWAFSTARAQEIDAYFARRRAEKPSLFDGPVLLARRAEIVMRGDGRVLEVDAFETRFSRFLAWRDFGFADSGVVNFFSMPATRSNDGAYLVGEMNGGHSSAGALYFPGGTPDPADVLHDRRVDLYGSLVRELLEETGLDAREADGAPGWSVVFDRQYVACIKRLDWPASAAGLRARAERFLAAESDPELAGIHLISRAEQLDDPRFPAFMVAYLERAFGAGPGRG